MQTTKIILATAMLGVLGLTALGAQAAMLNNGDQLTITASAYDSYTGLFTGGSYFALDIMTDSKISTAEKVALSMGQTGIITGQPTTRGPSHNSPPTASDVNAIDAAWSFLGSTGSHYTTIGITGGTTSGLDMSGWTLTWNDIPDLQLGTGAWVTAPGTGHTGAIGPFTDGVANFTWSGVYGTAYSLDYRATVPTGHPSGFGDMHYELHLEGIVNAAVVPVPAAAWLLGSGVLGLLGVARHRTGAGWRVCRAST